MIPSQDDPEVDMLPCIVCGRHVWMAVDARERDACCSTTCEAVYDAWADEQRRSADLAMPPVTELGGEG